MKTQQLALLAVLVAAPLLVASDEGFVDTFDVPKTQFTSTGKNAYFNLEPGYQMTFEGKEDGHKMALVITVLDETKTVDGVETRIVEERETSDGKPIEISRNYFALDMRNNDKADPARGTKANENFARELMQLFTIGLSQLNQDGTLQLARREARGR